MINRHVIIPFHRHFLSTLIILLLSCCILPFDIFIPTNAFSPTQYHHRTSQQTPSSITTKLHSNTNTNTNKIQQKVRAAVFQPPAKKVTSSQKNPLEILTQAADVLRIASMHGVDIVLFPELYLSNNGNDGLSPKQQSSSYSSMDREGYELNIVGNMCEELNVACIIGYAESIHESELFLKNNSDDDGDDDGGGKDGGDGCGAYNSIAAFHADGSRAGNYRSVSSAYHGEDGDADDDGDDDGFRKGHPIVEFIPTVIQLPNRQSSSPSVREGQREIKVGILCENDIYHPEPCRHLVRSGAQAIFASTSFTNNDHDHGMIQRVIPCRAMENQIPFSFANYVDDADSKETNFVGSSAIVSRDGNYLVCGPREEDGDMPSDCGYLVPCEVGTLYAADMNLLINNLDSSGEVIINEGGTFSTVQQSIEQWDLTPRMPEDAGTKRRKRTDEHRGEGKAYGFGREKRKKGKANKINF